MVKKNSTFIIIVLVLFFIALIILSNSIKVNFGFLGGHPSDNIVSNFSANNQNRITDEQMDASLILQSVEDKKVFHVGDVTSFTIAVNPVENSVLGVDAIVNYPANKVSVEKIETSGVFDAYPLSINKNNKIYVSAIMNPGNSINGVQKIATVTIKFLNTGRADIYFDFIKRGTVDSNVMPVGGNEDILGNVTNIFFDVE